MFRFRQFSVNDDQSTMKVGTDAMLLGAWTIPPESGNILEIGTGSGVIALMLAQKTRAMITAIDIDKPSVIQAERNFQNSRWKDRLVVQNKSLREISQNSRSGFDLIVTNPPFFTGSLLSPEEKRNLSRHTGTLRFEDLAGDAASLLKSDGRFALILPYEESTAFLNAAASFGLKELRKTLVFSKTESPKPVRILIETGFSGNAEPASKLIIRNTDGSFTSEYLELTIDYHYFSK